MDSVFKSFLFFLLFHLSQQDMGEALVWKPNVYSNSRQLTNCSKYTVESSMSCACYEYLDRQCILCCTFQHERCCFPYKCSTCLDDTWGYMTLMQITISVAIFIAVGFVIVFIFKLCNKYSNLRRNRSGNNSIRCPCSGPCCCSCIIQNRSRPPRYNEIYEAPPIYNTISTMQTASYEPPPTYPGTLAISGNLGLELSFPSREVSSNGIPVVNHV